MEMETTMPELTPTSNAGKIVALDSHVTEDNSLVTLFWTYEVVIGDNVLRYVVEQRDIPADTAYTESDLPTDVNKNAVLSLYGYVLP